MINRRNFLGAGTIVALTGVSGCARSVLGTGDVNLGPVANSGSSYFQDPKGSFPVSYEDKGMSSDAYYGALSDGGFHIPAVPDGIVEQRYQRQIVSDPTGEAPGTIVVDPNTFYLYLVRNDGTSLRYGIGVGREGFSWSGTSRIQYKRKWPTWKPPNEMVARRPELERYSIANGGMQGGPDNPLGARALYLFQATPGGVWEDTLYRIHGNPDPRSIGRAVSSGCIRMLNQDVIDLFDRVPSRAPVVVRSAGMPVSFA